MRLADISGTSATVLGADLGQANQHPSSKNSPPEEPSARKGTTSPTAVAVALTAVLAATLFMAYDAVRTIGDTQHELAIIGSAIADDLVELEPQAAAQAVDILPSRFSTVARASLGPAPDASAAPTLLGQFIPAGQHGMLALEAPPQDFWSDILLRGGVAFALAGLLTAVAWQRRGKAPESGRRRNYGILAAAIPMGVACWTKTGRLVVCNDQYRERLNLRGKTVSYHDAVRRMVEGGYMKLLNEDENNRVLELHRSDGSCLLIDERPLGDGGFMTLVSDVTERKKTDTMLHAIREEQRQLARRYHEEKLKAEAANRAKTNFLAHLSHDIRTPLNHIIGFADLMRHQTYGPLGDARYADYVQSIKSSGEHLLSSFATILDLAELESGHKALRHDPVPVEDLLDSVMERFTGLAARARLRMTVSQACDAIIEGDRLGLVRMISNIVDNAVRFTPPGGAVTLSAFAASDGVVIEITDTGLGMSQDRLASLSHPFALDDATFAREGMGPGLGISIARAIAELSGGHLVIDSSPSVGTTVAISLPLHANNLEAAA